MGNSNSLVPKFLKIQRKHKRKKKSIAIPCSDEGNQNYFECLFVQNGILGHVMACTSDCKQVRGEIILEQHFTYDDKTGKDYQHEKISFSVQRKNQKESVHNTLQKLSYGLKAQMPRKYDVRIGSCHDSDESSNIRNKYESINSEKKGSSEEVEGYLEIYDLAMESLQDDLDMDKERFIEHWQTTCSMGHNSVENSVVSDDAYNNPEIEPDHCIMYSKADDTILTGIVNNIGMCTLSRRCSLSSHSTWNGEDNDPRDAGIAIAYETAKNDVLVVSDAIHNKGETGPEPFVESSLIIWDIEDYVSSENGESISCIQSINTALDNNGCLDANVIAADKCKKDDDDGSHDGYIKKHQHFLMRDSKYKPNIQVESTEPTTSCQMLNQLNEEASIYNDLNEPQSDGIFQHFNSCNTKLGIQIHGSYMPFNLEIISKTEPSLSSRESNISYSGCSFNERGIKTDTREMSRKKIIVCNQPGRIHSSSVQSHRESIPFSELGIVERDLSFQQGTLARLSSDDENLFKRRLGLRWIFQFGSVSQRSVLRLQHWLRHQLYPFTNIKEFWASLGTDSPPSIEECMSVEWMRYCSFQNYPISAHGSTSRLARDGFYYTGQGTQTRCFSCGITHNDWNGTDNPREVHQRLSPNCPFLNRREERYPNIPMSTDGNGVVNRADGNSVPLPSPPIAPVSGSGTGQSLAERRSESSEGSRATKFIDEHSTQNLGSGETTLGLLSRPAEESAQSEADNRPKYPEHDSLPSRIATFTHGWPPYLNQTPKLMAEAGFFFTGNQDYTRCYHCGGGLRNWEPGDNPWIEHCRWYPMCPHVQRGKGQRFVNAVLKKQAELLANQRAVSRMKTQYGSSSTDPLETLAAITVLEMGYPRDTVRNTILTLRRQKESGAEINAQDVLDFIWKEEDTERRRQEEEASRSRHPGDPKPPMLPTLMECLNLHGSPAVTQTVVLKSASNITTSSLTTAAMTLTSNTVATSSTIGAESITSMSTSASGTTQNSRASGQEQKQEEDEGNKTNVGGAGDNRGGSIMKDGGSEANVKTDIHAQNQEISNQEQQRPVGAVGGHPEVPGAMPEAVEDEEFHSLDSEEMEEKDPGELEEENKRLKDQTTCKICMENPVRVIFIPCGHLVCCEACAPAFRKCPICRKKIQQSVKTFL